MIRPESERPRPDSTPVQGRPADRPRRLFHAGWRRLGVFLLASLAVACATPPAVRLDGPVQPVATIRVLEAGGKQTAQPAASVLKRLDKKGDTDLLALHLAQVERVVKGPLALGNEARLLIDGPQTHAAMLEAIAGARRSINLESYIVEEDEAGERLAVLLKAKRAEGVTVNFMYDSVGSFGTPREYFDDLRAAGVAVCEFNPVNPLKAGGGRQLNNRDHRKILIVDGRTAFTGGVNISAVYRSSSFAGKKKKPSPKEGWRDTHVQVSGPVVEEFQHLFLDTWKKQNCSPELGPAHFPVMERKGDKPMRLVAADPEAGQSEFYVVMLSAITHADNRVWLTYGYFVPDEGMLTALKTAARRGVDVRLVLPGFSDFWAPFHAGRSRYQDLLASGVKIFERRDALLHAKTAVIDGVWASIGSTNLDWRSFVHNYEADLVVLDNGFAKQMETLFRLDESTSHEISREEWEKRGLPPRMKEWVARWWEYFL